MSMLSSGCIVVEPHGLGIYSGMYRGVPPIHLHNCPLFIGKNALPESPLSSALCLPLLLRVQLALRLTLIPSTVFCSSSQYEDLIWFIDALTALFASGVLPLGYTAWRAEEAECENLLISHSASKSLIDSVLPRQLAFQRVHFLWEPQA